MAGKHITEYSIPEFVLTCGGSMEDDESHNSLGCCKFIAAVNKWYQMNKLTPMAVRLAAPCLDPVIAERMTLLADRFEHAFNELNNIIQVGLVYDGIPCEGGEQMHQRTDLCKKDLTLIKK